MGAFFSCSPSASGTFRLTATVTDVLEHVASASTYLTVYPVGGGEALEIAAFTAAPSIVSLGNSTVLELLTLGVTANLTYQYTGLPTGCVSESVPALPCTPTTRASTRPGRS